VSPDNNENAIGKIQNNESLNDLIEKIHNENQNKPFIKMNWPILVSKQIG
jgi:hypothetical protein